MIRLLEKHVADKIAAGEVVDRPLSAVKELVENSIDAGASSITVEIRKGGKEYIRVSDNGCGIEPDQVLLAFKRHATSKIYNVEDLTAISTLGFRGEALASIAAVSRTELITRTADEAAGTKVEIDGSETAEVTSIGCDQGTTVIVRDLFYNTPARRKFLKSDSAESTLIIDFLSQIALCYPEVRIKAINNGSILFSTPGRGDRLNAIATIYGRTIAKCLVPVEADNQNYSISGYVSNTGESRNSRKNQIFFVNGRVVSSKLMERAVKTAYQERLFPGRYPLAFLFLNVPAETIDVNIHPNKRDVRFDDERKVEDFTVEAIRTSLRTEKAAPEIHHEKLIKSVDEPKEKWTPSPSLHKEPEHKTVVVNIPVEEEQKQIDVKDFLSTLRQESKVEEEPVQYIKKASRPFEFTDLQIKGTLFDTYIIAEYGDNMYLIDQHAGHERVFYEKLMNIFNSEKKEKQLILTPILIEVPASVTDYSFIQILSDMGFTIEEFGPRTYKAGEIPYFMGLSEAEEFLKDYISAIGSETDFSSQKIKDSIATRACKAAVKGNQKLSDDEIKALLNDMNMCENPYSCPHGRPTYIRMSKSYVERMFRRV